jgi:catalase
MPVSFTTQSYYGVDAFQLVNQEGAVTPVRYRIHPMTGDRHMNPKDAAGKPADFLFDELREELEHGSALFRLMAQIPSDGDLLSDPAATWTEDRRKVELGIISVDSIHKDSDSIQRELKFDPMHLVDGIELTEDSLPISRSALYGIAFDRRNQ